MPETMKMAKQRRIVARLILDLIQRPAKLHLDTRHFSSRADDLLLMCAITIGQIDGRPMTAAKLADYAGMPRPTVARKLRDFQRAGMVRITNGAAVGVISHVDPEGIEDVIHGMIRDIHKAATSLSNLDTLPIAKK
jgi:hypothetical protein